ncbi:hypothetical protein, partial [Komagataeibacter rhaeticus]|uniref:hypothetical protein n=1 Tax=Komagataeibacter rhaeticus TaxID=215221 RepID=UPI00384AC516
SRTAVPDLLKAQIKSQPKTINQSAKSLKSPAKNINQRFFDPSRSNRFRGASLHWRRRSGRRPVNPTGRSG